MIMLAITPPLVLGLASDITQTQMVVRSPKMIRLAMLSVWHVHALEYAHQAIANPVTEITAVCDETPERGRAQAQPLAVPFYENLTELSPRSAVDGVMGTTPTTMH